MVDTGVMCATRWQEAKHIDYFIVVRNHWVTNSGKPRDEPEARRQENEGGVGACSPCSIVVGDEDSVSTALRVGEVAVP